RSVSGAVAAIDVVAAQDLTGELLRDEVHLVRGLRAAEQADSVAAVPLGGAAKPLGCPIESLVPGGRAQRAVLADHRLGESREPVRHRACPFPPDPPAEPRFYAPVSAGRDRPSGAVGVRMLLVGAARRASPS